MVQIGVWLYRFDLGVCVTHCLQIIEKVINHVRQKKAYFHIVNQTVPLLVSLGAQYLWEGWCVGKLAKASIVLT